MRHGAQMVLGGSQMDLSEVTLVPDRSTGSLASQRHPGKFPKVPGNLACEGGYNR